MNFTDFLFMNKNPTVFSMHLYKYLQMTDFMGGHDNARKSASVFNNGDAVDFFKTLVYHTRASHVRES